MAGEQEFGTKMRLLMVMRALLEQPYRYTKKELARRFKVDPDTIKSDFEAFKNAGFDLDHDKKTYRYAFKADKPYEELKSMLDLSEADQLRLLRAISEVEPGNPEFEQLKRRLASLIEYAQKEHNCLRRPASSHGMNNPEVSKKAYTTLTTNRKKVVGDSSGKIIVQKRLPGPAQSIAAASIRDFGMDCRPARKNRKL